MQLLRRETLKQLQTLYKSIEDPNTSHLDMIELIGKFTTQAHMQIAADIARRPGYFYHFTHGSKHLLKLQRNGF